MDLTIDNSISMEKVDNYTQNQSPVVDIGVKIEIEVNGEPQIWEIVGPGKSDILNGKISCTAPLIQCLLGRKRGEVVDGRIVGRSIKVTIRDILFSSGNMD